MIEVLKIKTFTTTQKEKKHTKLDKYQTHEKTEIFCLVNFDFFSSFLSDRLS